MQRIDSFSGEYRFLSNFWQHPVYMGGKRYPTNEHAFQAAKTTHVLEKEEIRGAETPGLAKRLGRTLSMRKDWEDIKQEVMYRINRQKFLYNDELGDRLIATGDAELIEGNHWGDTYWGVCSGQGQNHLGKILMRVREDVRHSRS
jgi:ribA/ribD-fused uncharacterized protein